MVMSPRQFSQNWWREVLKKVKKSLVFIDDEAAECLHWNGGLFELISAGATNVKQFSSFEKGESHQKKAIFITASSDVTKSKLIVQDLIQNSHFEYCIYITAAHPLVHNMAKYGGLRDATDEMSVFQELEEDMLHWMGNLNYTVEIFYFPLFLVSVTDTLFLTPPFRTLFPLMDCDLPNIQKHYKQLKGTSEHISSLPGIEIRHLPLELQVTILHLASCLHSFLGYLDVREDIFILGHTSGLIANVLENLPSTANRRKSANSRCSLLLLDRTVDLATAVSHGSDALLDKILAALPRLNGQSSDVAVNMTPVCSSKSFSLTEDSVLAPGCLAHDTDPCPEVLEWLVNRKQKDVLLGLHQLLAAAIPAGCDERIGRITTRVTPHILEKQVAVFKGQTDAIIQNSGLLEQTLAVTQALKSPNIAQHEQLWNLEKLMFYSLSTSQDASNVQEQIRQLLRSRHERGLQLPQLLSLLVYVYSLGGTNISFSPAEEREMQAAMRWALQQDHEKLLATNISPVPENADDDVIEEVADKITRKLRSISQARKDLSTYRSLLNVSESGLQDPVHVGLIQRLISDLMDPARPDVSDLTCRSSGLKELLKSSFSLLLNRTHQQHPLDNPLIIVYVVGGLTAQEVHAIQSSVSKAGVDVHLLVGGTQLTSAKDIVQAIFVQDMLSQFCM
ncbi:hypothetical protein R5R35_001907 [Gryllus longicercus]|uniref:Sec1 family domain-containing protein 2 n=1 Tax=Gryllus longicercus TaxID=2509291 RepID=A0AAN9ZAF5_9ORTH